MFTITYTTKTGRKKVECGKRYSFAVETFRKKNRESREVIFWMEKRRKPKQQTGKKVAQSFRKRRMLAISEVGTLEAVSKKTLTVTTFEALEKEVPKPTRKKAKCSLICEILGIEPELPKGKKRTVQDMNLGDIFIRWDGEEFCRIGPTMIENTKTGIREACEKSCKGIVTGNRLGTTVTLKEESRRSPKPKKEKKSYGGIKKRERITKCEKKFIDVMNENGETVEVKVEDCFSRKDGTKVVWETQHENTKPQGLVENNSKLLEGLGLQI